MVGARLLTKIAAGLLVATATGGTLASGQGVATPPAPPVAVPAAPAISLETVTPAMADAAVGVPAASCTCGDRRGFSRLAWHRTQCKRHLQEHFFGYPEEFNEWPLGYALHTNTRTQIRMPRPVTWFSITMTRGWHIAVGCADRTSLPSSHCISRLRSLPSWLSGLRRKPALMSRDGSRLCALGRGSFPSRASGS